MSFRLAEKGDLQQIKRMYEAIVRNMNENGVGIWDEVYPCEFFAEDIEKRRLYLLTEGEEIVAAFALLEIVGAESYVQWEVPEAKALYLYRLGINVDYQRRGIAGRMLDYASEVAAQKGAEYLRLLVVDVNVPAIRLYLKSGFLRVEGVHADDIVEGTVLYEYGYEKKLMDTL